VKNFKLALLSTIKIIQMLKKTNTEQRHFGSPRKSDSGAIAAIAKAKIFRLSS
jgi:hypothetical protein